MKSKYLILIFSSFLLFVQLKAQHRIRINIPTAESEAAYIWRNIQDIAFFEKHNYQLSLPKAPLIKELKQKSKAGNLLQEDYERLKKLLLDSIYQKTDYQKAYEKIQQEEALLDRMINQLPIKSFNWAFKSFELYSINLTLYGPGGSFNPEQGSILIFTSPEGQFKNYANPANTIIHEIVHIGIEESIIQKFKLPHALKERIVDTFVSLHFGQYLPDYRIQDMGDTRTDEYLKSREDFKDLDRIVESLINSKD